MQRISFYALDNLQRFFPKLTGIREFIRSDAYLGKLKITVTVPQSLDFSSVPAKRNCTCWKLCCCASQRTYAAMTRR
ncbi:hypothetical protein P4909_24380 [Escherichia coli]